MAPGSACIQTLVQRSTVCPSSPFKWAPVVDGVWLLLGIGVLLYYRAKGHEEWIGRAGAACGESEAELERTVGPYLSWPDSHG